MNIEELRQYCLSKKEVSEGFPFDNDTLVFKVAGKMFVLSSLKRWEEGKGSINLKCDPEYALELRATYQSVVSGWHMSKKHWNTVRVYKGELSNGVLKSLIDHSYQMVVNGLPKYVQERLR